MQTLTTGSFLQHKSYRIDKVLGQGTFGITYLAAAKLVTQGNLGKMEVEANVAIKEFFMSEINGRSTDGSTVEGSSGSVFTDYRRKFRKEAKNLARLEHPGIVKVLDVFDENNTTYYVMEFVEGQNLDDYIRLCGTIKEPEAIRIITDIGSALEYMHSRKMLHLDIKPKNIMRKSDGKNYLIDFGLAKQFTDDDEPESSTSIGLGTPGYAPLEQAAYRQDGSFPETLDVYALGATLFKMLTGKRPPEATHILNEGFPSAELSKLGVSDHTIAAVERAMAPVRKNRYQSVRAFLDGLVATDGDPVAHTTDEATIVEASLPPVSSTPPPFKTPPSYLSQSDEDQATEVVTDADSVTNGNDPDEVADATSAYYADDTETVSWWRRNHNWLWVSTLMLFIGWIIICICCAYPEYPEWENGTITGYYRANNSGEVLGFGVLILLCYGISWYLSNKNKAILKWLQIPVILSACSCTFALYWLIERQYFFYVFSIALILFVSWIIALCLSIFRLTIKQKYIICLSMACLVIGSIIIFFNHETHSVVDDCDAASETAEYNDHEWVDLGLPSGLKWATCNIGASSPSDYGDYFAWGDTTTKSDYMESNCRTYKRSISDLQSSGIINGEKNLTPVYDAARANWGGSWRMPTDAEVVELVEKCTWTWTSQGGHNGYLVTGSNGNSIFLPAAGWRDGTSLKDAGENGYYWSSSCFDDDEYYLGWYLVFYRDDKSEGSFPRSYGYSVRAVSE